MGGRFRIAIIGGGIAGVSTAYHLAQAGESNVVVLERAELTSGSTWHAAGNLPHFAGSLTMMRLQHYTKELYRDLESRHGDIGLHATGALRLARTADRLDEFKRVLGMAKLCGLEMELLSPEEACALIPFMVPDDLIATLWDPQDGHVDPTMVTNALATEARERGVKILRNSPVVAMEQAGPHWELTTPKGTVQAETVINAAGFRANEIAALAGHTVPIASMEHQYLVTEAIPELENHDREIPMIRDPEYDASYYLRQERDGVIIGPYEHEGIVWARDGVPETFGQELLPSDLDRIIDHVALAMERVPITQAAGIKTIVNGPITYTPDGLPLVGPVEGFENYFLNCGSSFGIAQGGGCGKICAEWILNDSPDLDCWELDPRRFGDFATNAWVEARCKDIYNNEYAIAFAHEWAGRAAGRPLYRSPAFERHDSSGAVSTTAFGWERPAFFAIGGETKQDHFSFRRAAWFDDVAEECRAVRERVGILDLSAFAKFDVTGPDAEAHLDAIGANRMPRKPGGIVLTHALTQTGGVRSEFSVTRLSDQHFYLVSATAAEKHDAALLQQNLQKDISAQIENVTKTYGTFAVAGPSSRELLARLTDTDLANDNFPWLTGREIEIAGLSVRALRVNFVGELGWELHHRLEDQLALYDHLFEAGADLGASPVGLRAMDSLRLEKMYRGWRTDLTTEFSLIAAGMERFADFGKEADFVGRAALQAERDQGPAYRLMGLDIDTDDADAISAEPVFSDDGEMIGQTTSGGYGHFTGKSLALAYVRSEYAIEETPVAVDLLGERRPALLFSCAPYDPENERLKQ